MQFSLFVCRMGARVACLTACALLAASCASDAAKDLSANTGGAALSTCEIVDPRAGAAITASDDRNSNQRGIQIDVAVRVSNAPVGGSLELSVDQNPVAQSARIDAANAVHIFEGVTLASGLRVARLGCRIADTDARSQVEVGVRRACTLRFVQPAPGARVSRADTRPGPGGRDVYPVVVEAEGVPSGTMVRVDLGEPGAPQYSATAMLAGARATLEVPISAGPARLSARAMAAACAPSAEVRFEVEGGECSASLMLPRSFTSATDASPAPGFQARLCVATSCPDGSTASLSIEGGAAPEATVTGGQACFDVSVPEGSPTITARVEGPFQQGTAPAARPCVDVTPPAIAQSYPPAVLRVGRRDDRDPSTPNAIEIPVTGFASGMAQSDCVVAEPRSRIELRVNGEVQARLFPSSNESPFDLLARLLPGRNEVQVCATDGVGNPACAPTSVIDASLDLPTLRFASPENGALLGHGATPGERTFDVVVDAYRLEPGTDVVLRTRNGAWSCTRAVVSTGDAMRATFPVGGACPALVDGKHRLHARAVDALGNEGLSPELVIHLDTRAPALAFASPGEDAAFATPRIDVALTTDQEDGELVTLRVNDAQRLEAFVVSGGVTFARIDLPEGPTTLTATTRDPAGNAAVVRRRVVADSRAPVPAFVNLPSGRVLGADDDKDQDIMNGFQFDVRVAVPGEMDGAWLSLQVDDGLPLVVRLEGGMATFANVMLPEGPSRVSVVVVDAAGNEGRAFVDVRLHTGRPQVAITSPSDGARFTLSSDLDPAMAGVQIPVWIATTDAPPMSACWVVVDADEPTEQRIELEPEGSFCRGTITLAEGRHTLHADVNAQGEGRSLPVVVTLDTQAPVLSFESPAGEIVNATSPDTDARAGFQTDIVVRADAIETGQGAVLTLLQDGAGAPALFFATFDGNARAAFRGVTLEEGASYTFAAQAADLAGNVSSVVTRRVSIDRTPPTVQVVSPQDGALLGLADDESPLPGFQKSIDVAFSQLEIGRRVALTLAGLEPGAPSVSYESAPVAVVSGTVRFLAIDMPPLAGDTLVVSVRASDAAGNEGVAESRVRLDLDTGGVVWVSPSAAPAPTVMCASADLDPVAIGHQVDVDLATTGIPSGSPASVRDAQGNELGRGTVSNDAARVRVTLPQGDTVLSAVVTKPSGNQAATDEARAMRVDVAGPAILAFGCNGDQNGDGFINRAEDRNPATQNRVEMDCLITFADDAANGRDVQIVSSYPAGGALAGAGIVTGNMAIVSVSLEASAEVASHRLAVVATDACGNGASGQVSYDVVVDLRAPSASILQPASGTMLASADRNPATESVFECCSGPSGPYDVTASTSGAVSARLYANGVLQAEVPVGAQGFASFPSASLPQGNVTLVVETQSAAGNVGVSAPVQLFIDSIVPKLAIASPLPGPVGANAFNVRIDYRDLEAGRVIGIYDGERFVTEVAASAGDEASTRSAIVPVVLRQGAHLLSATVTDVIGNVGRAAPVAIDVVANDPIVTIESPAGNPLTLARASGSVVGSTLTVDVTVRTLAPPGSRASLRKGGIEVASAIVVPGAPQNVAAFTGASFADNESGSLEAKVRLEMADTDAPCPGDASNFCSGSVPYSVDISAPTIALGSPACKAYWNASDSNGAGGFDLTFNTNADAGRTVTVRSSSGGGDRTANVSGGIAQLTGASFPQGQQTLTATVTDAAGNVGTATCDVFVDVSAPLIEFFTATRADSRRDRVALSWPAPGDDGASGSAASYEIRYRACAVSAACPLGDSEWSSSIALTGLPSLAAGGTAMTFDADRLPLDMRLAFGIRATDAAGNTSAIVFAEATTAFTNEPQAGVSGEADWGFSLKAVRLTGGATSEVVVGRPRAAALGGGFRVMYADGRPPTDVLAADVGLTSTTARMGRAIGSAGDLDGDGHDDLIVGAPGIADAACTAGTAAATGRAYVFFGGPSGVRAAAGGHQACGPSSDADCYIEIPAPVGSGVCSFGQSVAGLGSLGTSGVGAMFAVGAGDLTVSSTRSGKVFVYRLIGARPNVSVELVATVNGGADDYHFGASACGVGDVNGDGTPDFVIGATRRGQTPVLAGRAYIVLGGARFDGSGAVVDVVAGGAAADDGIVPLGNVLGADNFGTSCSRAGDVDGDGRLDFAVSAPGGLRVYVVRGRADFDARPSMAPGDVVALAHASWVQPGEIAAGADIDGDGLADIVVGDTLGVYVFRGDAQAGVHGVPIATFSQSVSVTTGYPVALVPNWKDAFPGELALPDIAIGRVSGPAVQIRY